MPSATYREKFDSCANCTFIHSIGILIMYSVNFWTGFKCYEVGAVVFTRDENERMERANLNSVLKKHCKMYIYEAPYSVQDRQESLNCTR